MAPTILFVPGFWEGSAPFAHVTSLLQSQGYSTHLATLPSTGRTSLGNPGMKNDIVRVIGVADPKSNIGDSSIPSCNGSINIAVAWGNVSVRFIKSNDVGQDLERSHLLGDDTCQQAEEKGRW